MVVSDALRAGMVALIPILYPFTHHTLPVYALVFGLFTCNVFFLPSKSAITPELVPAPQLLSANALLAAAGIAATAFAALGGGWIVDHWGWPIALWDQCRDLSGLGGGARDHPVPAAPSGQSGPTGLARRIFPRGRRGLVGGEEQSRRGPGAPGARRGMGGGRIPPRRGQPAHPASGADPRHGTTRRAALRRSARAPASAPRWINHQGQRLLPRSSWERDWCWRA